MAEYPTCKGGGGKPLCRRNGEYDRVADVPIDDRNQILGLNATGVFKLDLEAFGFKI